MSDSEPASAVVDTNLIVSGLAGRSGPALLLMERLRHGDFVLVISAKLLEEYRRVLARPRLKAQLGLKEEDVTAFLLLVQLRSRWVRASRRLPVSVRDRKDAPILAAALGGKADYLVTGDQDLLTLRDEPALGRLRIVTAREFLAMEGG